MTDPRTLSNDALWCRMDTLTQKEREVTLEALHHLREIEKRKLYYPRGYKNLFDYVTRHLGHSSGSAHRRIASMRLLKELPELEQKIKDGKLTLTVISQAQTFFKKEFEATHQSMTNEKKTEVIKRLEGKSTREVDQELLSLSSQPEGHLKEKEKQVTATHVEMTFYADSEVQALIEKIKGLLAHTEPHLTSSELVRKALQALWSQIDPAREPKRKTSNTQSEKLVPAQEPKEPKAESRYIAAEVRRTVWKRDDYRCAYIDPATGKRCNSKHALQLDHYPIPFAQGGPSTAENLRLACAQHNQMYAVQTYGLEKMQMHWGA